MSDAQTPPEAPATKPPEVKPPGSQPDMAALMVRLAEIRREVEGPAERPSRPVWPWILGALIGLLLAPLVFGRGGCMPP